MIRLRVLGSTELHDADGREASAVLAQPKRLALLAYLAVSPGFARRDALHGLFWPDLDAAHAREALNQAVRFLRRTLGGVGAPVLLGRGTGELGVDRASLWCDAAAFRDLVDAGRFGEALDLYRGDLLPGLFAEQSAGFERWLEDERSALRRLAARAAQEVADARERERNVTAAVVAARRAAELASLDERAVRQLMSTLARLGDRAGSIHAFEEFSARLATELEAEPSAETRELAERIRRSSTTVASSIAVPTAGETDEPPANVVDAAPGDGWEVVRELARGGSAVVYLVRDRKHDRTLALKTLHPELAAGPGLERFLREIRITARLAHPHVLPLIDSGTRNGAPFLVMPYVAGETLRERLARERRLPLGDAIRIAGEIAEALDYAHRSGVVHRDIKPENILLADGHAIVADFGIAHAVALAGGTTGDDDRVTGIVVGSPPYMSPEAQAGSGGGAACDVYALGCVLVEMISGSAPERGASWWTLTRRGLPTRVARLAAECIAADPARRPRPAGEIARRLEALARREAPGRRRVRRVVTLASVAASIVLVAAAALWARGRGATAIVDPLAEPRHDVAVLYFDDLTEDGRLRHVATGLTEDLIDRLSLVQGIRVVSPNGVRAFRGGSASPDSIGRRVGAGVLVTGSVSGSGPNLRFSARLVDAATGGQLRSLAIQRPASELFAMQDSVSEEVALWLRDHLGRRVRLAELRRGSRSVDAWQTVHRAEELLREAARHDAREPTLLHAADSLLRVAARLDPAWTEPAFRRARIALARAVPDARRLEAVVAAADTLLGRRPGDPEMLALRGEAHLLIAQVSDSPDPAAALRRAGDDLQRAAAARPDLARAWALLGEVLGAEQRNEDAIAAFRAALDADPFLRNVRQVLSSLFFANAHARRFDDAEQVCRTARARYPEDPRFVMCPLVLLGHRGAGARDVAEAWREARRVDSLDTRGIFASSWAFRQMMAAAVLARSGLRDSARAVVARTRASPLANPGSPVAEAYVATLLGDRAGAVHVLEGAVAADARVRIGLARHPWFASLADEPRFRALVREP